MRIAVAFVLVTLATALTAHGGPAHDLTPEELTLRAAGLAADSAALLDFFHQRAQASADGEKLHALAKKLADPDPEIHGQAAAQLITAGPAAIPALRHVINDLDDAGAAQRAERCLEWLEGSRRSDIPMAAARLLAMQKPAGAVQTLLTYLPFADDSTVVASVKAALLTLAGEAGEPEPALLKALQDPLPMRRAVAVEVLCGLGQAKVMPQVRKLLADPNAEVRLQTALALAGRQEENAVGVLIDLLADAPPARRRVVEETLQQLAGEWTPNPTAASDEKVTGKMRRDDWADWWRKTDSAALLAEFRKRSVAEADLGVVLGLIDKLGDKAFAARERAGTDLITLGPKVIPLLREAAKSPDLERAQRAQGCLKQIAEIEEKHKFPAAAARLLALRKPAGATAALLAFLPFSDDEFMKTEVARALKQLAADHPDPILLKALSDPLPLRRAFAGEALAGAGADQFPAVRKLLKDAEPQVRLRVALALACARDREAVPALIDLVAELGKGQAWEAEAILQRLAGDHAPKGLLEDNAPARKLFKGQWTAWWKTHAAKVDLAVLENAAATLGFTLVVEMAGGNNGKGVIGKVGGGPDRVMELDRSGKPRWTIEGLNDPVDAHLLPGDHVLIAEYAASRVTERDLKGTIIWQVQTQGPAVNAQRLANGNTFIAATNGPLMDVDRAGKTVATINVVGGNIRAACKMANGQIVCITGTRICMVLDATGKEIKRFAVPHNGYAGAIDVTPKGTVLVPLNDNTLVEYDFDGKAISTTKANGIGSATRLSNGHTLIAYSNAGTVVELDNVGRVIWEYKAPPGARPFRARQR